MPLYDYHCDACGPFSAWTRMARAAEPADCPACATPARRVINAPFLNTMNSYNRTAHQRNEKSADAPMVMSRDQLGRTGGKSAGHAHHHGCGHHHHGPRNPAVERLTGSKAYQQSDRRWMIGH